MFLASRLGRSAVVAGDTQSVLFLQQLLCLGLSCGWHRQAKECGQDEFNSSRGYGPGFYPLETDNSTQIDFTAWHTYTVDWTDTALVWFVDGIEVKKLGSRGCAVVFCRCCWSHYLCDDLVSCCGASIPAASHAHACTCTIAQVHRRDVGVPSSLFTPPFPMYMILNTALTPWANASLDTGLPAEHIIDRVTWCTNQSALQSSNIHVGR